MVSGYRSNTRGMITWSRRLHTELLEDRRLPATFVVTNLNDGPVTMAGELPGSLRQAVYTISACDVANNVANNGGGGIYNNPGSGLAIIDSTLTGNVHTG